MPTVHLTKREAEVMLHRLTLDDCISEALTDVYPGDPVPPYTRDEAAAVASYLERELTNFGTLTFATQIERDVVEDAVDGNTFGPGLDDATDNGELTPAQVAAWRRTIRALNSKLAAAGIESTFPL